MTAQTPLASYMKQGLERSNSNGASDFLAMAKLYELSAATTERLQAQAQQIGIEFLSSPFDVPSVAYLQHLGLKRLKLPSGELVNPLMLEALAATGLPLILSTGMATLEEVRWAVELLQARGSGPLTLLHCLSQYPAEFPHVNLLAMQTLAREFSLPVGYSDHTPGAEAAVAAVALGAVVIEKHLTLDRALPGPDQAASMTPAEFTAMAQAIRNVESALGDGVKRPAPPELPNRKIVRKSLVLRRAVSPGTTLSADLLDAKRPGAGIPARELPAVLGRKLKHGLEADHILVESDLE